MENNASLLNAVKECLKVTWTCRCKYSFNSIVHKQIYPSRFGDWVMVFSEEKIGLYICNSSKKSIKYVLKSCWYHALGCCAT